MGVIGTAIGVMRCTPDRSYSVCACKWPPRSMLAAEAMSVRPVKVATVLDQTGRPMSKLYP